MLKISQYTFLRSLSVSCICLSLSTSYSFAMETEDGETKPVAPVATFAAIVKGNEAVKDKAAAKESLPLSRNFFPLSDDDRRASQTLLEKLKTFEAPEDQKSLFDTINTSHVSINALFEQLESLRNPSSSSGPHSSLPAPVPVSKPSDESESSSTFSTNLLLSSTPEILSIAQNIKTTVDTCVDSLRDQFGLTITYGGNPRVSVSFHQRMNSDFTSKGNYYTEESKKLDEISPSNPNMQKADFLKEEEKYFEGRHDKIIGDSDKFSAGKLWRVGKTAYYPTTEWEDIKVLTLTPFNYHLYAAMMGLLDETYTRLGILQDGKSIVEGVHGFKYGPFDTRYVGAYVLQRAEKSKASS
ncbi:MAG TPA: hypothetical protein PLY23_00730 [Alphaproteobacteria bacterium]|nr:hypothetical protein [Alphaproteobacteria bacterium]HQS93190.1 hypothetical protein [Alphaproteobacteria bacterium]